MQIVQVEDLSEREELLAFVQEVFGGFADGMQSPDFDPRSFLTSLVTEAYFLYVRYELRTPAGNC